MLGSEVQLAKVVLPKSLRSSLAKRYRKYLFTQCMRKFIRDPLINIDNNELLSNLVYSWGNVRWSALDEYLRACLKAVLESDGPILECGSGLSTVLMGVVAQRGRNVVWSLEHNDHWGLKTRMVLSHYEIESVKLCTAPLRDYGEFDWYDPPLELMPSKFSVVVCDGPPEATRGGRFGLLPVMKRHISSRCTILLDDAFRERERAIAYEWTSALNANAEACGTQKPFVKITIP